MGGTARHPIEAASPACDDSVVRTAASSRPADCLNTKPGTTSSMATRRAHIVVEPRPDGRWARQKNGTQRAASLHDTQAEAERAARAQARRELSELVVKGRDGRIQRRDSYGNDPRSSRG